MLSVRNTFSVLTLLVCGSFVAALTASQADSTGYSQFNKVNGIHKKIQNAIASIKNGLGRTGEMMEEVTFEHIENAIASFSELKKNHAEFITESSKLPNDGQQNLFPQLMEGEYKKGNTKENLKQLETNISEQEQKLIQSLLVSQGRLNKRVAATSDPLALSMLDGDRYTLRQFCNKIAQSKDFSDKSKETAAKISSELLTLAEDINTKHEQLKQTQENAALGELTGEYFRLALTTDSILQSKNPVSEQELTAQITQWSTLKSKFQALVLQNEINKSNRTIYIERIDSKSKLLKEMIQRQQLNQQNIFQRLAHALTKKQYIVSALVSITVVAGLAYGEHKHKVLSKFIFGQASAPEQILTQLSWWARTRNWFSGWLSKLTSLNRVRV